MSDGQPGDNPEDEVDKLKRETYFDKIDFFACGFGYGGSYS